MKILLLSTAFLFAMTTHAAEYPANIDYGQQGDFITKRATANGRAAVIMPIGPALVTQPERAGSTDNGIDGGRDLQNGYWDLSDLTNPTEIARLHCEGTESGCAISQPVQAHATVVRIEEDRVKMYEPTFPTGRWLSYDPSGATSAEQMIKSFVNPSVEGRVVQYGALTSPYSHPILWSYGETAIEDYYIRDNRVIADDLPASSAFRGELLTEWDHIGLTGVTGFPIWSGNILVYASDQAQTGLAFYDTSGFKNGVVPELLSVFNPPINKPPGSNGLPEFIGGYWMEPYGTDRVVFAARETTTPVLREHPAMFVVNYEDPSNPFLSCEIFFDQTESRADGDTSSNPMYVHFQDNYAYVDHFRVDIDLCEELYANDNTYEPGIKAIVQDNNDPVRDEFYDVAYRFDDVSHHCEASQYYRPLGQVGVFGGYDWHQTQYVIEYTGAELPLEPQDVLNNNRAKTSNDVYANYGINPETGNYRSSWRSDDIAVGDVLSANGIDRTVVSVINDETINEQGFCFVVMHDERDTTAPYIAGSAPQAGATNVPVDTLIHFHIPETLRTETLIGAVNVTNVDTGEVVASRQQLSHTGMLSVWPDDDLETNASYNVSVAGIQDFMGNEMTPVSYNFSTGSEVAPTPPPPPVVDPPAPTYSGAKYYPNQSGELSCSPESDANNVWAVNPDNDSVAIINSTLADTTLALSMNLVDEISNAQYLHPSSITKINDTYAVTYRDSDHVVIFNSDTSVAHEITVDYGSRPIASVSDGMYLYVSSYGRGEILKIDVVSGVIVDRLNVGEYPYAMAINNNRLLVTRRITDELIANVYDIALSTFTLSQIIEIPYHVAPVDIDSGPGVINRLESIYIDDAGGFAYIAASINNSEIEGAVVDEDNAVRAALVTIDLSDYSATVIDQDNRADPSYVSTLADGTQLILFSGNNLGQFNVPAINRNTTIFTGFAPHSSCATPRHLYIKNFTDRSVLALDVAEYLDDDSRTVLSFDRLSVQTVSNEKLSTEELAGLKLFYHSEIPAQGLEGYLSCATCHVSGGDDGRVWDVTNLGEGMRNTLSLNGMSGTRFGNLHWSQNFDEVQDFEFQMHALNGGEGFADFTPSTNDDPLTTQTSGLSTELDALAAYVSSLGRDSLPRSAFKNINGDEAFRFDDAQQVFNDAGCAACHSGAAYKDGLSHDVGTGMTQAGVVINVRTPTLVNLFDTAPYLHDGRAQNIVNVFDYGSHKTAYDALPIFNQQILIQYLLSLDASNFISDEAAWPEVQQ